jgi:DNA-directed RNA polymerase subunit RPC12/RpoP
MSPGETFIHFGCPHCTAPLRARSTHAGRRQRCPLCQSAVVVPPKSRRTDFEQYLLHDDVGPAIEAVPAIAVDCPVCRSRLTAPEDQVGQKIACPDCGTAVVVPPKPEPHAPKRVLALEEYALCEAYDPATAAASQPHYIPVRCGLCDTLMHATPEQVGSELTCPDCSTRTVVKDVTREGSEEARPAAGKLETCPTMAEEYEVREELGQPAADSVAHQQHVGFRCACGTRLHATVAEVGQEVTCPDCGRYVVVPSPPPARPKRDPAEEDPGQYDIRPNESDGLPPALNWPGRLLAWRKNELPQDRVPPRLPLLSGIFGFPWRKGVRVRWLWLWITAGLIAHLGHFGWSMSIGGGLGGIGEALVSLGCFGLAWCMGICWLGVLAISLLVVLCETAVGGDDVDDWPLPMAFVDWVGNAMFVVNSLFLSVLAGMGVRWLSDHGELPSQYAVPCTALALFPFILFSMLEANSAVVPFSRAVCRSLLRNCLAWAGFYVESTLVLAGALVLVGEVFRPGRNPLAILPAAMVVVTVLLIYFRLLGRLAWCCSRGIAPSPAVGDARDR